MANNTSFIRTDKAITQAFIDLLNEKPFEKITVQDILDRTPVTRATFYAHFHDKYEIAERMFSEFLDICYGVRSELTKYPGTEPTELVIKKMRGNERFIRALLNIHTENINLRNVISEVFKKEYLLNKPSDKTTLFEANVYAQARTELELMIIKDSSSVISFEEYNKIFINVALKLLRIDEDREARRFLEQKIEKNTPNMVEAFNHVSFDALK